MNLSDLRSRIEKKQARLAVIGLGYIGLPVACEFASAGFDVVGVESNPQRVEKINAAQLPMQGSEPGLRELLTQVVKAGRLKATCEYQALSQCDVVLICVETPVDEHFVPNYAALRSALEGLSKVMPDGCLVIIESTLSPGTMDHLVTPLLEESSGKKLGEGFYLGNCPERVMPGKLLANLRGIGRVIGGMSPETAETIGALYQHIVHAELDLCDCLTAELVKTVENAYRDVQIAFANEVALICEATGGDIWQVRELVNKSPGRQMLFPGGGVGGHCIPKDPWLLAYGAGEKGVALQLIPAARRVNDAMPAHVADLVKQALNLAGKRIEEARVLILGVAYLEDADDTRNSPSLALAQHLERYGIKVMLHDPFVPGYQVAVDTAIVGSDALVLMVKHSAYRQLDLANLKSLMRTPILVDGRGFYHPDDVRKLGFSYWAVGRDNHNP